MKIRKNGLNLTFYIVKWGLRDIYYQTIDLPTKASFFLSHFTVRLVKSLKLDRISKLNESLSVITEHFYTLERGLTLPLDLKRSVSTNVFAEENNCAGTVKVVFALDLANISRLRNFGNKSATFTTAKVITILKCDLFRY